MRRRNARSTQKLHMTPGNPICTSAGWLAVAAPGATDETSMEFNGNLIIILFLMLRRKLL